MLVLFMKKNRLSPLKAKGYINEPLPEECGCKLALKFTASNSGLWCVKTCTS